MASSNQWTWIWWCHPTILSSAISFFSCPQFSPHQGLLQRVSSTHQVAKALKLQFQHQTFYWLSSIFLFHQGDWNSKVGSQNISRIAAKFGLGLQNEAGQRLTEFCQENILVIAYPLFQQHKRGLYTWTSPDGQGRNQINYIICS